MKKEDKARLDFSLSILASIVAVIALAIAIWQGVTTRDHNRKSVRPLLTIVAGAGSHDPHEDVGVFLTNAGFGPAIIKDYALKIDGSDEVYRNSDMWSNFASKVPDVDKMKFSWLTSGMPIPAGESVLLVGVQASEFENAKELRAFMQNFKGIDIIVTYRSLYDEEFNVSFRDSFTNPQ